MNMFKMVSLLGLVACMGLTGCSEVAFSPTNPPEQKKNDTDDPDPVYMKESFEIDQDDSTGDVDILFVVDNSLSMFQEQKKLGERLSSFLGQLPNINWQIGITTTDMSDGPYGLKGKLLKFSGTDTKVLTKNVSKYSDAFYKTVVRKETLTCRSCPSSDEQPLAAAIAALGRRFTDNQGFFRPNTDTAVVVLTDEDEMSNGPAGATSPEQVMAAYKSVMGKDHQLSVYGIIVQPGDTACYDANFASGGSYGTFVARLAQLTGGLTGSICDSNYSRNLEKIGRRVKELLLAVELSIEPEPGSVQVTVTPAIPGLEWSIEGRKIRFSIAPPTGTKVDVSFLAKGSKP